MNYILPSLPYSYDALVPYIDTKTMEIHHTKHHQTYIDKLNAALKQAPSLAEKPLVELIKNISSVPEHLRLEIQNQGGGHLNHTFFWHILTPKSSKEPIGKIAVLINKHFDTFNLFQEQFNKKAQSLFGSGWTWLVITKDGTLKITTTSNQDNPISLQEFPLLGLDVWEHAYYLSYQNRRVDYISAWWNVVNWEMVHVHYEQWLNQQ